MHKEHKVTNSRGVVYKGIDENISVTEITAMELMNGSMLNPSERGLHSRKRISKKNCSGVIIE